MLIKRKPTYFVNSAFVFDRKIDWTQEPIEFEKAEGDILLKNFPDRYEEVQMKEEKVKKIEVPEIDEIVENTKELTKTRGKKK